MRIGVWAFFMDARSPGWPCEWASARNAPTPDTKVRRRDLPAWSDVARQMPRLAIPHPATRIPRFDWPQLAAFLRVSRGV
jgi:hypothetical protein